jgi:hypothetical protein
MGTVQTEGIELRLQDCTSGQEVAPGLRTDENGVIADTTYNYVNTYNMDSRKKYKYKSNQERLLYKIGCIRANDI